MSNNHPPTNDPFGMPGGFNQPPYGTPPGVGEYPNQARPAARLEPQGKGRKKEKKEKAPKTATKRLLNKQKVFALVFAVLAIVFALQLSNTQPAQTFVARTATGIPALSKIEETQYEVIALPATAIEEDAISAATEDDVRKLISVLLEKGRTRMSLPKGHQLRQDDFSAEAQLATPLGPNERLLAVEASVVAAIGGQLRAGDRVDVIAIIDAQNRTVSNIVATNIEIVSTLPGEQQFDSIAQEQASGSQDKASNELLPSDPVPGIYNVRVTLDQAVVLAAAQSRGELVMVLRGSAAETPATRPIELEQLMTQGVAAETPSTTAGG